MKKKSKYGSPVKAAAAAAARVPAPRRELKKCHYCRMSTAITAEDVRSPQEPLARWWHSPVPTTPDPGCEAARRTHRAARVREAAEAAAAARADMPVTSTPLQGAGH